MKTYRLTFATEKAPANFKTKAIRANFMLEALQKFESMYPYSNVTSCIKQADTAASSRVLIISKLNPLSPGTRMYWNGTTFKNSELVSFSALELSKVTLNEYCELRNRNVALFINTALLDSNENCAYSVTDCEKLYYEFLKTNNNNI